MKVGQGRFRAQMLLTQMLVKQRKHTDVHRGA